MSAVIIKCYFALVDHSGHILQRKIIPELVIYPGHIHQSKNILSTGYIKEILYITRQIIDGNMVGGEVEFSFEEGGEKYHFNEVTYGMLEVTVTIRIRLNRITM